MDSKEKYPTPAYTEHMGTIRVSASTKVHNCAVRALSYLEEDRAINVDFICIGDRSSWQAAKAMTLFRLFFEKNTNGELSLSFTPFHVLVSAPTNRDDASSASMQLDATVWRTCVLSQEQSQQLLCLNPEPKAPETAG